MYWPEKFMTPEMVEKILSEFTWPAPYSVVDESPDGIDVIFPNCQIILTEEPVDSEVELGFSPSNTGLDHIVPIQMAIVAINPNGEHGLVETPGLINDRPRRAKEHIENELRDLLLILLTHFRDCILGDFSWVDRYREYYRSSSTT